MQLLRKVLVTVLVMLLYSYAFSAVNTVAVRQPAFIPADKVLTLQDCVNLATQNHSSVRVAQAQILAQQGAVSEARAALLPAATVGAQAPVLNSTTGHETAVNFSANQLIYNFGRSPQLLKEAKQQEAATQQNLCGTTADLILSVKQAYYTLLQDDHLVDVFTKNLQQQQAHVEETEAQESAGVVPHTDVLTAKAAAASAQFDLVTAQNAANLARVNLNAAMGVDIRSAFSTTDAIEPNTPAPPESQLESLAFARRPEICRDTDQFLAAQAAYRATVASYLPDITASASYIPCPGIEGAQQSWAVSLNLQWTLIDFGTIPGQVKQARAQLDTAEETLYSEKQAIMTEVAQSRLNLTAAQAQEENAKAEVASAQASLDAAVGSYNAGIGIMLNVIDAQAILLKAQVDELTARYGLSIARANLEHATGGSLP